jgi:hypothetical protein
MNRILSLFLISIFLISCSKAEKKEVQKKVEEKIITEFGYTLNNYNVKKSKVKNGDSFGSILERNNLYYPQIYNIVQKVKKVYDIRKINIGKPYTILSSKDSLNTPLVFIYQPNKIDYVVVSLTDSLWAEKKSKAVKIKEFEAEGIITSSLSETMEKQKLSPLLSNELSEIYAWTIDFFRLEKGDNFKIIYSAKYIDDSIYVGLNRIHSAFFEHRGNLFTLLNLKLTQKEELLNILMKMGKI